MTAALILLSNHAPAPEEYNPLTPVGELSALRRMVVVLRQNGVKRIVVAGGKNRDTLVRHLAHMGTVCISKTGTGSQTPLKTLHAGLSYLTKSNKFSSILLVPISHPLAQVQTVGALLQSSAPLSAPQYKGQMGFPLLVHANGLPLLASFSEQATLQQFFSFCFSHSHPIPVEDPAVCLNLEEQTDWQSLVYQYQLPNLRPEAKILIARESICFGPGTCMLLTLLQETSSLRMACNQMGLSYSKGLRMVENMEQQLGFEVVIRKQGGQFGGHSLLTPKGLAFLNAYTAYEAESKKAIEEIFTSHFRSFYTQEKEAE